MKGVALKGGAPAAGENQDDQQVSQHGDLRLRDLLLKSEIFLPCLSVTVWARLAVTHSVAPVFSHHTSQLTRHQAVVSEGEK